MITEGKYNTRKKFSMRGLVWSIYIVSAFTICRAINLSNTTLIEEAPLKLYLVKDIIKKICNISLETFSKKSPIEKAKLMTRIEEKLNKSAQPLGTHGTKYVKLIMKTVQANAFYTNPVDVYRPYALRTDSANEFNIDKKLKSEKDEIVHKIINKIQLIAKKYFKDSFTSEERRSAIENIKENFLKSVDNIAIKNVIPQGKIREIKKYADLVVKGIEMSVKRDTNAYERREIEFVFADSFNLKRRSGDHAGDFLDPVKLESQGINELDPGAYRLSKPKSVVFNIDKKTDLITKPLCHGTLEEICTKLKLTKTLKCLTDINEFSILKLCDGESDCLDSSDERLCAQQAIDAIQSASRLIAYIDTSMSHNCYHDLVDKSMLYKQNKILGDVLTSQLTFLENHSIESSGTYSRRTYNTDTHAVRQTVREAVGVVDSLTSALGMSVCPNFSNTAAVYRASNDFNLATNKHYYDDELFVTQPAAEICKCSGQNCLKACTARCGKICYEMFTLSQFTCEAVSGEDFVSLDVVCDGKLDCYDEADEKDCSIDISLAKFEATNMYNYILKDIEVKTVTTTQESVRASLQSLQAMVKKFQKLSLKRSSDTLEVKRVRIALFEDFMKVYESAVRYIKNENDLFEMRFYLDTLKERLISALKRSKTGNDKIISSDGCVCRGYKCAMPRCSKTCNRACTAEPQLTRFMCDKLIDSLNNSVPIELICNGKANCPNGEDEKGCQIELCRPHHLLVLRHKLLDVGRAHKGTALGEALRAWRVKVTATLTIAESNGRPSPPILHDILHDVLHDLVMTYASLDDRRDTSFLPEFLTWSHIVIDTLKSCNA